MATQDRTIDELQEGGAVRGGERVEGLRGSSPTQSLKLTLPNPNDKADVTLDNVQPLGTTAATEFRAKIGAADANAPDPTYSFSDINGQVLPAQIPDEFMRDSEFTRAAVLGLLQLTEGEFNEVVLNPQILSGQFIYDTPDGQQHSLILPVGGGNGGGSPPDGVLSGGRFSADGTTLVLERTGGLGSVDVAVPALLRQNLTSAGIARMLEGLASTQRLSYTALKDQPDIPSSFSDLSGSLSDGNIPSTITRDSELTAVRNALQTAINAKPDSYADLGEIPESDIPSTITRDTELSTAQTALQTNINTKADQTAVNALTTTVAGKADQAATTTALAGKLNTVLDNVPTLTAEQQTAFRTAIGAGTTDTTPGTGTPATSFSQLSGMASDAQIPSGITRDTELAGAVTTLNTAIAEKADATALDSKANTDLSNVVSIPDDKIPDGITRDTELESARSGLQASINTKANSTAVTSLASRVSDNEEDIQDNATAINARATTTALTAGLAGKTDTATTTALDARVATNETALDSAALAIAAKANTSDVQDSVVGIGSLNSSNQLPVTNRAGTTMNVDLSSLAGGGNGGTTDITGKLDTDLGNVAAVSDADATAFRTAIGVTEATGVVKNPYSYNLKFAESNTRQVARLMHADMLTSHNLRVAGSSTAVNRDIQVFPANTKVPQNLQSGIPFITKWEGAIRITSVSNGTLFLRITQTFRHNAGQPNQFDNTRFVVERIFGTHDSTVPLSAFDSVVTLPESAFAGIDTGVDQPVELFLKFELFTNSALTATRTEGALNSSFNVSFDHAGVQFLQNDRITEGGGSGGGEAQTGTEIVTLLEALTGGDRLNYAALDDAPTIPAQRSGSDIAGLLDSLQGDDRLSYDSLQDQPTIPSISGLATAAALTSGLDGKVDKDFQNISNGAIPAAKITSDIARTTALTTGLSGKLNTSAFTGAAVVTLLEALTGTGRLDYTALDNTPTIPSAQTGAQIVTLLQALAGTARLDASAIRNLPTGGGSTYTPGPVRMQDLTLTGTGRNRGINNLPRSVPLLQVMVSWTTNGVTFNGTIQVPMEGTSAPGVGFTGRRVYTLDTHNPTQSDRNRTVAVEVTIEAQSSTVRVLSIDGTSGGVSSLTVDRVYYLTTEPAA